MKDRYTKKEVIRIKEQVKKKCIKELKSYQKSGNGPDYSYDGYSTYDDGYKNGVDSCIEALKELEQAF